MLRNIVGDESLAKALQAYVSADDHEPSYFQTLLQKVIEQGPGMVFRRLGLSRQRIAGSAYRQRLLAADFE